MDGGERRLEGHSGNSVPGGNRGGHLWSRRLQPRRKGGPYALTPPPILWGPFLCFRQRESDKDLQDTLEGLGTPGGPTSGPSCFRPLPPRGPQSPTPPQREPWRAACGASVRVFPLGLELPQGRSRDSNLQREETRPEKEGGESKVRHCAPDSEHPKSRDHLW